MRIQFCEFCMEDSECTYKEREKVENFDGTEIKYIEKYYICNTCGNEIYGDMLDENIHTVNNKLRKINNIITTDEIDEIIEKYSIGKKPLSLILGMGEINIIRYLNGSNPTREISDLLKSILDNPFLYELYLRANKDKITELAYKKSLGKTKQLELNYDNSKLYNVLLYIVDDLKEADQLSVQKILYFISGFTNKFMKDGLFKDIPEAWVHGPVYRDIYDCLSFYKDGKIEYDDLLKERDFDLTDEEKEYIDYMVSIFGCYSGAILREMTHLTDPWIKAREGLKDDEISNRIIEQKDIDEYFDKVCKEYNIKELKDVSKYSKDLFKKAQKNLLKHKLK